MKKRAFVIIVALCLTPLFIARGFDVSDYPGRPSAAFSEIRGITLAPIEDTRLGDVGYGSPRCALALSEIAALNATWISLTPFGRMDSLSSTEILHDFEISAATNEKMLANAARQARAEGLKIAIIPHIYVMSGQWRGEIAPPGDIATETWFSNYEHFVIRFARLAEQLGAELFSIGVEFKSTTNAYADRWRKVIALVRSVYSGALTYSANWDEVEYVPFWDDLDMIGINAFWPLATRPGDDFTMISGTAKRIGAELEGLAIFWNKPIIFTEFGVKTARDATLAPWEWPEHSADLVYDEQAQAAAYQAVLEAMTDKPWFAGLFIWKYVSDPYDETQEAPVGFSPRAKRAGTVLKSWYGRPWDDALFASLFFE